MSVWKNISDEAEDVAKGNTSAVANVHKALELIQGNDEYQAIISTISKRALERAAVIDKAVASGTKVGRLAGVPFIAKDNFLTFGVETTAASNMLKKFIAPYQATAIERLEAEGAICVAPTEKQNLL